MGHLMTAADRAAEADARERAALDEAKDQLRHGWTPKEVAAVLVDAHTVIAQLRDEAAS